MRANAPWPGSSIDTKLGRVAVLAASVAPMGELGDAPGQLVEHEGRLALATAEAGS